MPRNVTKDVTTPSSESNRGPHEPTAVQSLPLQVVMPPAAPSDTELYGVKLNAPPSNTNCAPQCRAPASIRHTLDHLEELNTTEVTDSSTMIARHRRNRDRPIPAVVGTSTGTSRHPLRAKSGQHVSVFVSRLDPSTTLQALTQYINSVYSVNSKCIQLKAKFNSYSSFKVDFTCDNVHGLYESDKWPAGVYVSKFFSPKK